MKKLSGLGVLIASASLLKLICLYLAGYMAVVYIEQSLQIFQIKLFGYTFHWLGPLAYGIVSGIIALKVKRFNEKMGIEIADMKKDGSISVNTPVGVDNELARKQLFIMGAFTLIMEIFLSLKGDLPVKTLVIGAIVFLAVWGISKIIIRTFILHVISSIKKGSEEHD